MRPVMIVGTPQSPVPVTSASLPWSPGSPPLMLAPMQGLTNRALRSLFIDWVRPDVVFTEFMRVNAAAPQRRLSKADLREIAACEDGVPLVVQLIGHGLEALVAAASIAQDAGAVHINLNLGCPYGRMCSGLTGGRLLLRPEELAEVIPALRSAIRGTFSIKARAGYDDPAQLFSLLPVMERSGVDFLVLHPRTVLQEYAGHADHAITAEVVRRTFVPVIANGDIRTAADGVRVLDATGAAGLMLGRGGIADPLLFQRLRGRASSGPDRAERGNELRRYLLELLKRYDEIFCGESQVLGKIKGVLATIEDPDFTKSVKKLRKSTSLKTFAAILDEL